ncbi:MAG: carboxypeptidase regulatory-like domain-containing protein, partial [Limisphaerales bacterium]
MNMYRRVPFALAVACAITTSVAQGYHSLDARILSAPPTPPPVVTAPVDSAPDPRLRSAATLHDIGDPTPEEQLYIEMINRARANPVAEAQLFANTTDPSVLSALEFFEVNIPLMLAQFATNPPVPPLAPNKQLTAAARRHSLDMLNRSFQGHDGSDGSAFDERISDEGYAYQTVSENVYANADSVFHGHAGFEVDWGIGPGGIQTPPGHRNSIHSAAFREIGVGVVFGENQPPASGGVPGSREVGPQLVSQEFGRQNAIPLVTGVVYFDLNTNAFYDLGEGVGGVEVSVSGTATRALTARSGGYAIPVAGNGDYTVTFSGANFSPFTRNITVASAENQKVDFLPVYTAPVLTGSATPAINSANNYSATPVPAAAAYQWRSFQL